jgi:succinyl-CoA synthetase alpha subunit
MSVLQKALQRPDYVIETIVQGITGRQGSLHTKLMLEYGTRIVAGVTPGRGGQKVHGVPVFDTVREALDAHPAEASVVFVPAPSFKQAVSEALDGGLKLIVAITEHVPIRDTLELIRRAGEKGATIVGPNTPGLILPGRIKLGIMPAGAFKPGPLAVFSRSGTLTYEICNILSQGGYGQAICLGIGGDPINGISLVECLKLVGDVRGIEGVVIVGEIGGDAEERAADYILESGYPKPVVAYVAGRSAPPEKKMGHAGAIISGGFGSAQSKIEAFKRAGVPVALRPKDVLTLCREVIPEG